MNKNAGRMVAIAAMAAMAAVSSSAGCVLGRPHTATVLTVDALGMLAGGMLMASYDDGGGRGEDSGPPPAGAYGEPILKVSAVCALATLVLYVVDREIEIAQEKRDKKEKAKKALQPSPSPSPAPSLSPAPLSLRMR